MLLAQRIVGRHFIHAFHKGWSGVSYAPMRPCSFFTTLITLDSRESVDTAINPLHTWTVCQTVDWRISKLLRCLCNSFSALCKSPILDHKSWRSIFLWGMICANPNHQSLCQSMLVEWVFAYFFQPTLDVWMVNLILKKSMNAHICTYLIFRLCSCTNWEHLWDS